MRRIFSVAVLLIAGCANPLNLQTAHDYFQGGKSNAADGKWFNARMAFGRAWSNAVAGKADERTIAVYAYEYGRASGAICDWKESEKALLKALEIDQKTGGPAYMSLAELARMYHASGQIEQSRTYFAQTKDALDRVQADIRDPHGYVNLIAEYVEVASALHLTEQSTALKLKEREIRLSLRGDAKGHVQTPYGQHCDQQSLVD